MSGTEIELIIINFHQRFRVLQTKKDYMHRRDCSITGAMHNTNTRQSNYDLYGKVVFIQINIQRFNDSISKF